MLRETDADLDAMKTSICIGTVVLMISIIALKPDGIIGVMALAVFAAAYVYLLDH